MKKSTLNVAIDAGDFCVAHDKVRSGITRMVAGFLNEAKNLKTSNIQFRVYYFNSSKARGIGNIHYKKLPQVGFASYHLPRAILKDKNEVYLAFSTHIPAVLRTKKIKKISFLYDLGFYKYPSNYMNPYRLARMTKNSLRWADTIIATSNYMKKELSWFEPSYSNKIQVIYPGIDHLKTRTKKIEGKYFLYVGVIKPIKNIERLLLSFDRFLYQSKKKDFSFILIGTQEKNYFTKLIHSPLYKKLKEKITFIKTVSDEELLSYYASSVAVINLSFEEGFGFPVMEASYFNKPVIVNDLPIYKEFSDTFKTIKINKEQKDVVKTMINVSKSTSKKKSQKTPSQFTWKNFTKSLIQTAKSI